MARPIKEGMDYFPHDTDAVNDEKIDALRMIHGNDGYAFYFIHLERIYRCTNFELDISDAEIMQILSKKCGLNTEQYQTILNTALKFGCFDKDHFEKTGRLTSNGIKKRAAIVIDKRERMRYAYEKRISNAETIAETTQETYSETPQSKEKDSKEKNSKVTPIKKLSIFSTEYQFLDTLDDQLLKTDLHSKHPPDHLFKLINILKIKKEQNRCSLTEIRIAFENVKSDTWLQDHGYNNIYYLLDTEHNGNSAGERIVKYQKKVPDKFQKREHIKLEELAPDYQMAK